MPLLEFWKTNREIVLRQSVTQVVSNAGDGRLRDETDSSHEFREFLKLVPSDSIFAYSKECLEEPFAKSGLVLQDLVNELGRRLNFDVENGLYQGRRNAIGFDGVWRYPGEPDLLVEVKSTDAYTISLDTINKYRLGLIKESKLGSDASILIVVGREDTGALEAQVRGSRFAWDIRLISVDRLVNLVQVKEKSDDSATVDQIRQLLHPFEYTKLDRIIDVIFTTAKDVENQQEEIQPKVPTETVTADDRKWVQERTEQSQIDTIKERCVQAFSAKVGVDLIKTGRSYYWSADKKVRVVCTASKRYDTDYQPYWYAYHPRWDEFLSEGDGYLILACIDHEYAYAIPREWFAKNSQYMNTSQKDGRDSYWHIALTTLESGELAINLSKIQRREPLTDFAFKI